MLGFGFYTFMGVTNTIVKMPPFPKPKFSYPFNLNVEIERLLVHKQKRNIPELSDNHLLISTWNIANLGLQKRHNDHYKLIAEIISWFDIIAIQEINVNLEGLRSIEAFLPSYYDVVFSDKGGNNERSGYLYNSRKVNLLELIGEVAVSPKDHRYIKISGNTQQFKGFDRNPYLCSFSWNNEAIILITVHSFFGSKSSNDINRRALEAYAIARHAHLQAKSKYSFSKKIITLGDFNIPKVEKGDAVYEALISRGLKLPEHSTKVYSNINNDKQFDQIAFFPKLKSKVKANGVFDFDSAIFPDLWQANKKNFKSYVKYYLSDHRPLWFQLKF